MSGSNNQRDSTSRYVKSGIQNTLRHVLRLHKACHIKNSELWVLEVCFCLQLRPVNVTSFCECLTWICGGLSRTPLERVKKLSLCPPKNLEIWDIKPQKGTEGQFKVLYWILYFPHEVLMMLINFTPFRYLVFRV